MVTKGNREFTQLLRQRQRNFIANFPKSKLFQTAIKMDKDKKTDENGSLSSGDFVSNDFLIRQGCVRSRDVVINNFSNEIGLN